MREILCVVPGGCATASLPEDVVECLVGGIDVGVEKCHSICVCNLFDYHLHYIYV